METTTTLTSNDFIGDFDFADWDRSTDPPECPICTGPQWNGQENHLPECGTKCRLCHAEFTFRLSNTRNANGEWLFGKECDCMECQECGEVQFNADHRPDLLTKEKPGIFPAAATAPFAPNDVTCRTCGGDV